MKRIVPYNVQYNLLNKIKFSAYTLLIISAGISVITLIVNANVFGIERDKTLFILNSVNCLLSVIYFLLDIISNYIFQSTEQRRRSDFIDNGLCTNLSEENSVGYFSNENIEPGIFKLGVNCFENSFFTKSIAGKMIPQMIFKAGIMIVLYLLVALSMDHKTLTTLLQVALPFTIIKQTVRLVYFHSKVKNIFERFQSILSFAKSSQKTFLLISNVIDYEALLSWAGILLNKKLFNKLNPTLSTRWEELKGRYNII